MNEPIPWTCAICGTPNNTGWRCDGCDQLKGWKDAPDVAKPVFDRSLIEAPPLGSRAKGGGRIVLTTAPGLDGYRITETLEIISAECACGMNIFQDIMVAARDLVGGNSQTLETTLRDARRRCMAKLRAEAAELRADAVIAVDLDYSEFSGKGTSMLFLVATGTAVRVEPVRPAPAGDKTATEAAPEDEG